MGELINKQEVVDLLNERASSLCGIYGDLGGACSGAAKLIMQLPSAQPEIVRCKDCKHHWTHKCMDSFPIERCDLEQTFYNAEHDFCSLAERREDG